MLDVVTNLSCLSSSLTKNWLRTLKESQNCLESLNCRCTLYCPNCLYSPFCPYSLYCLYGLCRLYLIVSEHCLSLLSRICDCGVTHKIPHKLYPYREKVANMVAVAQEFWLGRPMMCSLDTTTLALVWTTTTTTTTTTKMTGGTPEVRSDKS